METPLRLYTWRLECERFDASCHRSPCCFTDHFTGILDTQTILHVHAMCFATRRAFETSETRYLPTRKGWTSPAASRSTVSQCLSHSSWKTLRTCLKRTAFGVLSQVTVCSVKTLVLAQTLHSSVDLVLGGSWTSWISSLPSQSFRRCNHVAPLHPISSGEPDVRVQDVQPCDVARRLQQAGGHGVGQLGPGGMPAHKGQIEASYDVSWWYR